MYTRPENLRTILSAILLVGCTTFLMSQSICESEVRLLHADQLNPHVLPSGTAQLVIVTEDSRPGRFVLSAYEKKEGMWTPVFLRERVVIGSRGFARAGEKREGDGKTPTGVFPLGMAFGYGPTCKTGLLYRMVSKNDFWVDDVNSTQYNQWVTGKPDAASYEVLKRNDDLYKYAIVVEYNTNPVVRGKGSAIFVHVWRDNRSVTAGCVAMPEECIVKLLAWLDAKKNPFIAMGSRVSVSGFR